MNFEISLNRVKVVTINILFEMEDWEQRRELLVQGLAAEQADLIGLQEVKLPEDTSIWLSKQLEMPYIYLVPYCDPDRESSPKYGAAILSRYPFIQEGVLDLQGQGRSAQYVQVEIRGHSLIFCNGHYYWYPGHTPERTKQIELLLNWLGQFPAEMPVIAVGDFNGTPETPAIALMREKFSSAYAVHHGQEPEYTCPTPLVRKRSLWRRFKGILLNLWANRTLRPWRGTLDYIFVNQNLNVRKCEVILNQPDPDHSTLYPSDHFGLAAELEFKSRP